MKSNTLWWILGITGGAFALGLFNRKRVMENLKSTKLGPNFDLSEFVITSTGLDNIPNDSEVAALRALVTYVLQPLRNAVSKRYPGKKVAVNITSGFRSFAVNSKIGGSTTSQHMKGEAADFNVTVDGVRLTNQQIIDIIRQEGIPYDQLIDEQLKGKMWVHVSYTRTAANKKQWLTARDKPGGGTQYATVKYG